MTVLPEDRNAHRAMRDRVIRNLRAAENPTWLVPTSPSYEPKGEVAEPTAPPENVAASYAPISLLTSQGDSPPRIRSCFEIKEERCTRGEESYNSKEISYLRLMNAKLNTITGAAAAFNSGSRDNRQLVSLCIDYEQSRRWMLVLGCEPSLSLFDRVYDLHLNIAAGCRESLIRAMTVLFASAETCRQELLRAYFAVRDQRYAFENTADGNGGLEALRRLHGSFLSQLVACHAFQLVSIGIRDRSFDASEHYEAIQGIEDVEKAPAAIDELDELRNEYVLKFLDVPRPTEFSQSKRSRHFTFEQLNVSNDYDWAVLTDVLLKNLDLLADSMAKAGHPIQLNSAYRNPLRSVKRSQHQYGLAMDMQVFDFDESGGAIDAADWQLLADLVSPLQPGYLEPLAESGPGHVHADWRS
jgi:hypothetical protein